jgi:uncharacterized protein (TIGR02271 family)
MTDGQNTRDIGLNMDDAEQSTGEAAAVQRSVPVQGELRSGGHLQAVATLELREERAVWQQERVTAGQVQVRREVQTRTETVSTELRREVLIIETSPGGPAVYVGDQLLQPGEQREIVLYDEQATLQKVPYVTEEVRIGKRTVTERHEAQVELKREVLVVEEHPPIG